MTPADRAFLYELRTKLRLPQCYVREEADGSWTLVSPIFDDLPVPAAVQHALEFTREVRPVTPTGPLYQTQHRYFTLS